MSTDPATDRATLVERAYASSGPLSARSALYRFAAEGGDLVDAVLDDVEADHLPAGGAVLDVGCGPGTYLARLASRRPDVHAVGVDLSAGMAREANRRARVPAAVADAAALPVRRAGADLVLAAHMLYHLPEPAAGAAELARVCRPGGVVVVVTNAEGHLAELRDLASEATGVPVRTFSEGLRLDGVADAVAPALEVERLVRFPRRLEIPEPGPVLRYLTSLRPLVEPRLRGFGGWSVVTPRAEALLRRHLDEHGTFTVHAEAGWAVCRPRPA